MSKLTVEQVENIKVGEVYQDPYRGIPDAYFVIQEVEPMSTRFGKANRIARGKVIIFRSEIDWSKSTEEDLFVKRSIYKVETISLWVGDLRNGTKLSPDFAYFNKIKTCNRISPMELK